MEAQHNWKRYWYSRDKEHIRSWWEKDEWFSFPVKESQCFVQIDELAHVPCAILLGDAGLGKSKVIESHLAQQTSRSHHVIDLRHVSSPTILKAEFEQIFQGDDWKNANDIMYLYFDALDEGLLLIDNICNLLLKLFKQVERSRVYVRVACRPGLFPGSFERELRKLWGEQEVQVYQLAPLFLEDIALACNDYGIETESFLADVKKRNMHGFAYSPVTLNFLLPLFTRNRNLPETKTRLFELGCLELCRERKQAKPNSNFISAEKRYEVAMLLAAITKFCNKPIFSNLTLGISEEGILELRDWPAGFRHTLGYSASDAEEVLRTGLFREIKPMQFGWAHNSYAEFLAAQFLLTQKMTSKQMGSLVFSKQWNVFPQLLQTVAWLGDHSEAMFDLIVKHDPEVLCLGEPSRWSVSQKRKALKELLARYEKTMMYARLGTESFYRQLYFEGVEILLADYLKKDSLAPSFVRFILFFIRAMDAKECTEHLYELMNSTVHSELADGALSIYVQFADDAALMKLKTMLGSYTSDYFVRTIVRELYPSLLSFEEVISYLRSWQWFKDYTILDLLSFEDQNRLWDQLLEEELQGSYAWSSVLDYVIVRQAELLSDEELWTAIGRRRVSIRGLLFSVSAAPLRYKGSWEAKVCLLTCTAKYFSLEKQMLAVHWFGADELTKLVELYLHTEDLPSRTCLLYVIAQLMNPYNKEHVSYLQPIYSRLEQGEEILPSISLDSPVCSVMKELPIPEPPSPARKDALWERKTPVERMRYLLELARHDAQKGWPVLVKHSHEKFSVLLGEKGIMESRLWRVFTDSEREQLVEVARCFLREFDHLQYPLEVWSNHLRPVHYALQLVWERDSFFIERMGGTRVEVLLPYIVDPSFDSFPQGKEMFAFAYRRNPSVIDEPLLKLQRNRSPGSWQSGRQIAENRIAFCWDEVIREKVMKVLSEPHLFWTIRKDFLKLMYSNDPTYAHDFSQKVVNERHTGLNGWKKAIAALSVQLDYAPDGGSEAVISLLESVEQKDERFLYAMFRKYMRDRPVFEFRKKWNPDQLMKLYVWIHQHAAYFPYDWQYKVTDWKQIIIGHGFGDSKLQPSDLLLLSRMLPDCEIVRYHWELVRHDYERERWAPPAIDSLIHMINHSESRPITSGEHMLEVLCDSLLTFESEWRRSENPLIPLLWNEQREEKKRYFAPKDENTLSDVLKYHFSKDLDQRGVTLHREVEIYRSQGGESGALLDIKLEIPTALGSKPLRVYIEVKGCWNDKLEESLEQQLIQKYMLPHECSHGLYVIGWYKCPQWDKKWDYRAGDTPNYSLAEARRIFQEKAEELSRRYHIHVEVVVLDLSLR
ncbi:hypothetical protein [Brevibacillus parabrevis]|uniref:NACHT domain-containing protein n=1 Tax=Brevibacillus parabrevis TaxID=54914 RepID=UPI002E21B413|nr:hypothetical protein [Brevibacillus parabrevis]